MLELEILKGRNWKTNPHWLQFFSEGRYCGSVWSTEAKLRWSDGNYSLRIDTILFLHFTGILLRPKGGKQREWIKLTGKKEIKQSKS